MTATWEIVRTTLGVKATDLFYEQLFKANEDLKTTAFKNVNIERQAKMLFGMLDQAVVWLGNPDELVPALIACGQRHVNYDVDTKHYYLIGENLIRTLKIGLADRFKPESEAAWGAAFEVIMYWMILGDNAERVAREQA